MHIGHDPNSESRFYQLTTGVAVNPETNEGVTNQRPVSFYADRFGVRKIQNQAGKLNLLVVCTVFRN